jgi:hypothetical protein
MTKLTQTQQLLLRSAADAESSAIDAPENTKTFSTLIKQGLVIALPQADGPSRLIITDAGRAAVADPGPSPAQPAKAKGASKAEPKASPPAAAGPAAPAAPKGKLGVLVTLLRDPNGATVAAMAAATGWQVHSVRGAMSGALKKGLGLDIASERTADGRVYRITGGADA